MWAIYTIIGFLIATMIYVAIAQVLYEDYKKDVWDFLKELPVKESPAVIVKEFEPLIKRNYRYKPKTKPEKVADLLRRLSDQRDWIRRGDKI